jgi:hypothetical protein
MTSATETMRDPNLGLGSPEAAPTPDEPSVDIEATDSRRLDNSPASWNKPEEHICAVCLCACHETGRGNTLGELGEPDEPGLEASIVTRDSTVETGVAVEEEAEPPEHVAVGTTEHPEVCSLVPVEHVPEEDRLKETARALHCGHVFHAACIAEWFLKAPPDASHQVGCPTCRQPIELAIRHMQLVDDIVGPRARIRWQDPLAVAPRAPDIRRDRMRALFGQRWECKEIANNILLHFGYPILLFAGAGGVVILMTQ